MSFKGAKTSKYDWKSWPIFCFLYSPFCLFFLSLHQELITTLQTGKLDTNPQEQDLIVQVNVKDFMSIQQSCSDTAEQ